MIIFEPHTKAKLEVGASPDVWRSLTPEMVSAESGCGDVVIAELGLQGLEVSSFFRDALV